MTDIMRGLHRYIEAAFGQTLLALKIYSARNVHYRFSALIASARTQPEWTADGSGGGRDTRGVRG